MTCTGPGRYPESPTDTPIRNETPALLVEKFAAAINTAAIRIFFITFLLSFGSLLGRLIDRRWVIKEIQTVV
jgi:hypothetical protein